MSEFHSVRFADVWKHTVWACAAAAGAASAIARESAAPAAVPTAAATVTTEPDAFRILAWNVESNRPNAPKVSDPEVIAAQLTALMRDPATRAEVVALSEVEPRTVPAYQQAIADGLGGRVDFVTSASGGFRDSDSLLVVVDADRFTIEDVIELHRYRGIAANFNVMDETSFEHGALRARSPLAVRLRERDGQRTFWVIANHLARGEADLRIDQARLLRQWAEDHDGAIVAVGDFNFDWDIPTRRGNAAFDAMLEGDVWEWLEPESLVDTNWTNDRQNPGHDRYPDSILDFVFVAKAARDWRGESRVVVRPGDFPDDETTSDHRPVLATLRPPAE